MQSKCKAWKSALQPHGTRAARAEGCRPACRLRRASGHAENNFTIHPGIFKFEEQWYDFHHNAALTLNGERGLIGRRAVCVEHLFCNPDGTIESIIQTKAGISVPPARN